MPALASRSDLPAVWLDQVRERLEEHPLRNAVAGLAGLAGFYLVVESNAHSSLGESIDAKVLLVVAALTAPAVAALLVLAPWRGLLAWLIAMPLLNATRSSVTAGDLQIIFSTIAAAALAAGWLLRSRTVARSRLERPAWIVAATISALALAAAVHAGVTSTGLTIAVQGVVVPAVVGAAAASLLATRRQLVTLSAAMGASVVLASAYNILRLARDTVSLGFAQADRGDFARFTYYNVGIFGDMLAITMPLLVAAAFVWRSEGRTIAWKLAAAAAGVEVVAAYLSFTKSAWLGCLAGITLTLLLVAPTWQRRIQVLVASAIIAALFIPYPAFVLGAVSKDFAGRYDSFMTGIQGTDRAQSWNPTTAEGEVSIVERLTATKAGLAMTRDHPLLGVGPGGFEAAYAGAYRNPSATRTLGSPHDVFVDLSAEFGLPMAALVTLVLASALVIALRTATRTVRRGSRSVLPPIAPAAAGLAGALVAFVVVGVTFGIDLYRPWRYHDSDVVFAALLIAAACALPFLRRRPLDAGPPAVPAVTPVAPPATPGAPSAP